MSIAFSSTSDQMIAGRVTHAPPGDSAIVVPERPSLRRGVELVGEMPDTGFAEPQWLIQRDGRYIQVSRLLYRVAEHIDGRRSLAQIAEVVTACTEWLVTADDVRHLLTSRLIPLGIVAATDSPADVTASPAKREERSSLQVRLRVRVLGPQAIDAIARVLQRLFAPPILIPLLGVAAVVYGWLYAVRGVSDSVRAALYMPGGLLLVFGLVLVSGLVHEFGHAAALRYGGGRTRGMGMGVYLVYPTFYTDTTDAYRLGRTARLRTDLGGMYFHLLFGLVLIGVYFTTGYELLLAVVLVVTGDIAYQLVPFVRLDGYWALADLMGVPDPLSQAQPFLRSMAPNATSAGTALPRLKRRARIAFLAYLILAFPALVVLTLLMVLGVPQFMTMGWEALLYQVGELGEAHGARDAVFVASVVAQIALLSLSLLTMAYLLASTLRKVARALWRWSTPTPTRRVAGSLAGAAVGASLAFLWSPTLGTLFTPSLPGVQEFDVESRRHVMTPVSYPQDPPVGGNHYPIWQNCGFYDIPVAKEKAVHSMEHGAVWITYRPDLPRDQIHALHSLARSRTYVLVSPYPGLGAPVVASAWGRRTQLGSADDAALHDFVRGFRLGRQAPERGAECSRGVGTPLP